MAATALTVMAALGVAVGAALIVLADPAVALLADVPDRAQTVAAVRAMGWSLPAITLTSGLRGILEAKHAFGLVNLVRLPLGVFTFVGPVLVAVLLEPRLDWIAWALVAGRWAACFVHAWFAWRVLPQGRGPLRFAAAEIRPLLAIGGWLTVSNIVSPLMGYADRFIIAGLVSASAVAYYATPYEIVTKLWIVPGALTAVLFPTFAAQAARDAHEGAALVRQSVTALALLLLPVCAFLGIFAHEILSLWLNDEFARHSAPLLRIFALGILINSTAHIPYTLIQGAGRPKWTAMILLAEAVPFLLLLWWATAQGGALGAALAWLLRIVLDTTAMFLAGGRVLGLGGRAIMPGHLPTLGALTLLAMALAFTGPLVLRGAGFVLVSFLAAAIILREPAIARRLRQLRPAAS
jgi:O-antigen/teichoic acid export membrane protein